MLDDVEKILGKTIENTSMGWFTVLKEMSVLQRKCTDSQQAH